MSDRLPVFHIGANKAGSTTLQRALFARHPDVLNLGRPAMRHAVDRAIDTVLDSCDPSSETWLALDTESIARVWRDATTPAAGHRRVPVFSREDLIRNRYYGPLDHDRLPKAIAAVAGPVRVVIVVRHQLKLIESLYIHKTNIANYRAPDRWLETNSEWLRTYRFYEVADAWARVIGEENVGVFLFEELVTDSTSFAKRLCDFIGIDPDTGAALLAKQHENARKSQRVQAYVRLRAALFPQAALGKLLPAPLRQAWRRYLESGPGAAVELPPHWLRRIEEIYRTDNRKLAERFNLPLRTYDYPM